MLPETRSEDPPLSSFAGRVLLQPLCERSAPKSRLRGCVEQLKVSPIFGHGPIGMLLIAHLLLGDRRLSDLRE